MIPADATTRALTRELIVAFKNDPSHSALLLDFDGTLTPIEKDPEVPTLTVGEIDLLHRLSISLGTLAIVSGRTGSFLVGRLGFDTHRETRLIAFGRGGLDAIDSKGTITADRAFEQWNAQMRDLAEQARDVAPLAWIEEKGVVLTFHWRRAPATEQLLREVAQRAVDLAGLVTREGKQSIEVFPPGLPNKSEVVRALSTNCRVVAYFGDDIGDLEAFDTLDELEASIQTFRGCVAGDEAPTGMAERADLVLASSSEMFVLLGAIADELNA
ncbi:MAG TPA: trehalose-phosphatase [Acidimicrobiales bacterium]|nr:trehalose-phosphatase [Acidimicrobiales bacterium]